MKIQAILFMCNDFARAKFTLENFSKWNPDIPIRLINSGGNDPRPYLDHIPNITFIDTENLWHKSTHCGKGSFGPKFAKYFFDYGLNEKYTHTLLLETDVLTNRKITIKPLYDISGITNYGGDDKIYEYLQIHDHKLHSGCGGTIFSYYYFKTILEKNTYDLFNILFNIFPKQYYMDFILSVIGRKAGCSIGNWEEVSETKPYVGITNGEIHKQQPNLNATLVHDFKI